MKPLLVFARIIIIGCLWSIVFIEGIRVIMLCNWHFDIFWPDHWRQFFALWKAGWIMRAPKEWAFVIILATFIPMLITGWWTLSLIAWEYIIFDLLISPLILYRHLIKAPINVITTNNKYGVVKRKSYKQIRPSGISRTPISDYGDSRRPVTPLIAATSTPMTSSFSTAGMGQSSYSSAPTPMYSASAASSRVMDKVKKPDIPSTINHALFKFDDDDDFDLDIDSFEKSSVLGKSNKSTSFEDLNNIGNSPKAESKPVIKNPDFNIDDNFDDDDVIEASEKNKNKNKKKDNTKDNKKNNTGKNKKQNKNADNETGKDTISAENNTSADIPQNPIYDTLKQKGYDVISDIFVNGTLIDYIAVSENQICLLLVDKEEGDWLADEELFNGEEPLWFSESGHRVSPVRKLGVARKVIQEKISAEDFSQELKSLVVIQASNIINADDMFDIWQDMNIEVARIGRGGPKEIKLLAKSLSDAESKLEAKDFDRLQKLLKSIK